MGGLRQSLIRTIRYFVLKPAALIGLLVGALVVVGLILAVPLVLPRIPGVSTLRGSGPAPTSTEDYLKGNQNYDADLMWNSLDGDAQSRLSSQGGSRDDLQQQMNTAKQKGVKLEDVAYMGGKALPDGTSMQLYLVGIRQQQQTAIDYQPYMFTLDRDGKIAKVQ